MPELPATNLLRLKITLISYTNPIRNCLFFSEILFKEKYMLPATLPLCNIISKATFLVKRVQNFLISRKLFLSYLFKGYAYAIIHYTQYQLTTSGTAKSSGNAFANYYYPFR